VVGPQADAGTCGLLWWPVTLRVGCCVMLMTSIRSCDIGGNGTNCIRGASCAFKVIWMQGMYCFSNSYAPLCWAGHGVLGVSKCATRNDFHSAFTKTSASMITGTQAARSCTKLTPALHFQTHRQALNCDSGKTRCLCIKDAGASEGHAARVAMACRSAWHVLAASTVAAPQHMLLPMLPSALPRSLPAAAQLDHAAIAAVPPSAT
jgi:hypothetical protein